MPWELTYSLIVNHARTPIQTMFDPNPQGGVVAVALTPDSRFLATLSALPIQVFLLMYTSLNTLNTLSITGLLY